MSLQHESARPEVFARHKANRTLHGHQYTVISKQPHYSREASVARSAVPAPSSTTESIGIGTVEPIYCSEPEENVLTNGVDKQLSGQIPNLQLETTDLRAPADYYSSSPDDSSTNGSSATSRTSASSLSPQTTKGSCPDLLEAAATNSNPTRQSNIRNKATEAFQDASFFLGGLIKHPTESNKHFTILRHSHGLVYYRGPDSSLALTVFADAPLNPDRQYWLQMKGWTGNTGMKAKALFRTTNDWINVTPSRRVSVADLAPTDEKAWQRDVKTFRNNVTKQSRAHFIRETIILRLPFEAADGYFRVNMTNGNNRRPLCSSPVFRVASTSMSAGSVKGASLGTLPLEMGVNALQFAARQMAMNAISPVVDTARQQVTGLLPSAVQDYGQTAYNISGVDKRVESMNDQYEDRKKQRSDELSNIAYPGQYKGGTEAINCSTGPSKPFPIHLRGRIVQGSIHAQGEYDTPTFCLDNIPTDQIASLRQGTYYGWACFNSKAKDTTPSKEWQQTIVTISQQPIPKVTATTIQTSSQIAIPKTIQVHLINHGHDTPHLETLYTINHPTVSLLIMGYFGPSTSTPSLLLQPNKDPRTSQNLLQTKRKILTILSHPSFHPDFPHTSTSPTTPNDDKKNLNQIYTQTRTTLQRQIDRVPVHRLGVRNHSSGTMDRGIYGNGGCFVLRDV